MKKCKNFLLTQNKKEILTLLNKNSEEEEAS